MSDTLQCHACGTPLPFGDGRICPQCGTYPHSFPENTLRVNEEADDRQGIYETLGNVVHEESDDDTLHPAASEVSGEPIDSDSESTSKFREFGKYLLEEELARGGMGVVYRARDRRLNRIVAVKMIRSGELADPEEVLRFGVEAEAAAALDHPAIVPVYDVGEIDGQNYYSMAFIDGVSLSALLHDGPLPALEAVAIIAMIADAIDYAHSKDVIHRDLKPGNILLVEQSKDSRTASQGSSLRSQSSSQSMRRFSRGNFSSRWQPRVTDFGLAKRVSSDSELTSTGQVLGTPSYMPPEQARGEDVGPAADVYSLGSVLYAMLVGHPPFQAANVVDTINQVIEQQPVSPSRFNAAISRDLGNICLKCLEKSPGRRYATAGALADDLYAFVEGKPVKARPVSVVERTWRWCRRKPMTAVTILTVVFASLALTGAAVKLRAEEAETRQMREKSDMNERLAKEKIKAATVAEYYSLINEVAERISARRRGWAFEGLKSIAKACRLDVPNAAHVRLRSMAASCITGLDANEAFRVKMPPGYRSHRVAVDMRHQRFAVATLKNRIQLHVSVCDLRTGKQTHKLNVFSRTWVDFDGIVHVVFLDNGNTLAIVTRTGYLHRWKLSENDEPTGAPKSIRVPFGIDSRIVFDTSRGRAFMCHEGGLYEWSDFDSEEPTLIREGVERVWDVSPDGASLALLVNDRLEVYDTDNESITCTVTTGSKFWFLNRSLLAKFSADQCMLYDAENGELRRVLSDPFAGDVHDGAVRNVDLSPDGALLATSGGDQRIKLWSVATGDLLSDIFLGGGDEVFPVFAGNNRLVTSGDYSGIVFELNGRDVASWLAIHRRVQSFDMSQHPFRIVTGRSTKRGGQVTMWNELGTRRLHTWNLSHSSFSPNLRIDSGATTLAATLFGKGSVAWAWGVPPALRQPRPTLPIDEAKIHKLETDASTCAVGEGVGWFVEDGEIMMRRSLPDFAPLSHWSNELSGHMSGNGTFADVALTPALAIAVDEGGHLFSFSRSEPGKVMRLPIQEGATVVDVNSEQSFAVYGTRDGEVRLTRLVESAKFSSTKATAKHLDVVTSVAISPDSQLLASASFDRTIALWAIHGSELSKVLTLALPKVPSKVRFTPSGDIVRRRAWRMWGACVAPRHAAPAIGRSGIGLVSSSVLEPLQLLRRRALTFGGAAHVTTVWHGARSSQETALKKVFLEVTKFLEAVRIDPNGNGRRFGIVGPKHIVQLR